MSNNLRRSTAAREEFVEALKAPVQSMIDLADTVEHAIREQVSKGVEFVNELRYGIDQTRLDTKLGVLSRLDEESRREGMQIMFREALNDGFEVFYRLMVKLGDTSIFKIVKDTGSVGENAELPDEDLVLPLQMDYELYIEAIKVVQESGKLLEWATFLEAKVDSNGDDKDEFEELALNGAALPEMFPKITRYVDEIGEYTQGMQRGARFVQMSRVFQLVAKELFGDEYEAFYGVASKKNFEGLVSRFWGFHPDAELIAGAYEYLPMVYAVPDEHKRHVVELDDINFSEDDLLEALFARADKVQTDRERNEQDKKAPIVFLISTQARMGAKLLDVQKIERVIESANEMLGYKLYHVWFDSSQDSRVIASGDAVFYSKRFAGSGGGMVLAKNDSYPTDDGMDIKEAFRLRSSYDATIIPRLIASLHLTGNQIGHQVSDLTKTPGLWFYKGKGTFLAGEIAKAEEYIEGSDVLRDRFRLASQLPENNGQWKVDAVLRVEPIDEELDFQSLVESMSNIYGVDCSNFNLSECNSPDSMGYKQVMEAFNSNPFDLEDFKAKVLEFQTYYQSWVIKSLLPSSNLDNAMYVRTYFASALAEHDYFRLFLTVLDRPDYLLDFMKRLEEAVDMQTA